MNVLTITKENFDEQVLESDQPVMLDFWAPWCGYCRRITPAVEQLASEKADQLRIGTINIDEQPALAERFAVETIPTLLLFRKGALIGDPIVAPASKAQISTWIVQSGAL